MRTSCDVAWAAGLFEGEGTIGVDGLSAGVGVGSTDEDVITRFATVVGVGNVHERKRTSTGKRFWYWKCSRAADVLDVLLLFREHLGSRRQGRADEAIAACIATQQRMRGPFICSSCGFAAGSPGGLGRHKVTHQGDTLAAV